MSGKYLWLLDNGHGGVIDGLCQTSGKRSPQWQDGSVLYEGECNRGVVNRLMEMMTRAGYRYINIVPELEDISLNERVRRANSYHNDQECIYVSIHSNAGGGRGNEVFTSVGQTRSDQVASVFIEEMAREFPEVPMRTDKFSDGDLDKEANFYVLKNTRMPAILTENFFMDNEDECKTYLMTSEGRERIARAHFNGIQRIERDGI